MAETLGTLRNKLTITKLKHWHTEDPVRRELLEKQFVLTLAEHMPIIFECEEKFQTEFRASLKTDIFN